ncbi:hypothetical protein Micbo1qcDRAFT_169313 [Microdochium bolleyi]|uniref:Uncharacterized protein n=1 Tax=Microdochium bolleyi TaxID=196109 RepID=A0A136IKS6_9PEZI|nr:hypothetical protein Micbo1qcDRAFT_169313 [Microdochium bolleyi]
MSSTSTTPEPQSVVFLPLSVPPAVPDIEADTEATEGATETEKEYIIDPRGDLWLHASGTAAGAAIPGNSARFRVCSRALSRSSSVFDKMLFGPFAEGTKSRDASQEWVVDLPGDSPSGLRPLLEIMHGQFQRMAPIAGAQRSTIQRLYDVVVVADKYDCIALLRPWAASWTLCYKADLFTAEHELFCLAWIFYQVGYISGYETVVTQLVLTTPPGPADDPRASMILPPKLYETVTFLRAKLIASLLDPIRTNVERLIKGGSRSVGLCRERVSKKHKLRCESSMLGELLRSLHESRLWPIPKASDVLRAPSSMALVVNTLNLRCVSHAMATKSDDNASHWPCVAVAAPYRDREAAGDDPWVYSTDYHYTADEDEVGYMARQAELSAVHLHAPDELFPKGNILFAF